MSHRRTTPAAGLIALALITGTLGAAPADAKPTPEAASRAAVARVADRVSAKSVKRLRRVSPKAARLLRSRPIRKRLARIEKAAALAAQGSHAAGTAAGGCAVPAATETRPTQTIQGVSYDSTAGQFRGTAGSTDGATATTVGTSRVDGASLTQSLTIKKCVRFDPCPAADGAVTGDGVVIDDQVTRLVRDGVTITKRLSMSTTARYTARDGADARVPRFAAVTDSELQMSLEARQGKRQILRYPTTTFRLHATRAAIDPRNPVRGAPDTAEARGPKGRVPDWQREGVDGVEYLSRETLVGTAARTLLAAEHHWADARGCATLALDPAATSVSPGQRVDTRGTMKAADGTVVEPATWTFEGLTSAKGTGPLAVAYDVPATAAPGPLAGGRAEVVSPAGIAVAAQTLDVIVAEQRFAVSVVVSQHFRWKYAGRDLSSPGTDSECDVVTTGSGAHDILAASVENGGGTARLRGDELTIAGTQPLITTVTATGSMRAVGKGPRPGCAGTTDDDQSECGTDMYVDPVAVAFDSTGDGAMELEFSRYRDPVLACPFQTVEYPERIDRTLRDRWFVEIPYAKLRDPSVPVVELAHAAGGSWHEDCKTPDAPGCTNDRSLQQSYDTDVTRDVDVRVRLTRVAP